MSLEARMGIIYANGKIMFRLPKHNAPGFRGGSDKLTTFKNTCTPRPPFLYFLHKKAFYLDTISVKTAKPIASQFRL